MNQEKIGNFIAQRRKDKKLTQAKLASYLGIKTSGLPEFGRSAFWKNAAESSNKDECP